MSTVSISPPIRRDPELLGQTVVVIGGSAGIGFETARRARADGAKVILTGRNAERLQPAAREVDALSTADLLLALYVARNAVSKVRPRGTLIFMGGTGGRRPAIGMSIASAGTAALPANLALEIAPVRVNLIAAAFVDTPLSAELPGDQLERRRNQLRTTLPIGRVLGPVDVAALAVHIMTNTALTGATYDIDGGQQFVPA
jgi:NAD(P)-dependent dehydrogenase (short-subunit alcohol dehydrogenase family)